MRPDKHPILDSDAFPHHVAVLQGHVVAQAASSLDETVVSNVTSSPDAGTLEDMGVRPNACPFSNFFRLDQSSWVNVDTGHDRTSTGLPPSAIEVLQASRTRTTPLEK